MSKSNNFKQNDISIYDNILDIDEFIIINNEFNNINIISENPPNIILENQISLDIVPEIQISLDIISENPLNIIPENTVYIINSNDNMINNWYKILIQQSLIYKWVLNKNKNFSDNLIIISIVLLLILGFFLGIKIFIVDNIMFQITSNIILMLLNFSILLLIILFKKNKDNKRNKIIKIYIQEIKLVIKKLSKTIIYYKMDINNIYNLDIHYNKLILNTPKLFQNEIQECKQKFILYKDIFINEV
jgi:hypothetical protein